jgi:hypothetical protein
LAAGTIHNGAKSLENSDQEGSQTDGTEGSSHSATEGLLYIIIYYLLFIIYNLLFIIRNTLLVGLEGIAVDMKYQVAKRPLAVTCTTFLITVHISTTPV